MARVCLIRQGYHPLDTRVRRPASLLFATALGALLSLMIEVAQVYVSVRVPSLKDLALNTLGAALGATAQTRSTARDRRLRKERPCPLRIPASIS